MYGVYTRAEETKINIIKINYALKCARRASLKGASNCIFRMLSGSSFHSFILLGKNEILYISPRSLGLISVTFDLVLCLRGGIRKCSAIVISFLTFSDPENISNGDTFFVSRDAHFRSPNNPVTTLSSLM